MLINTEREKNEPGESDRYKNGSWIILNAMILTVTKLNSTKKTGGYQSRQNWTEKIITWRVHWTKLKMMNLRVPIPEILRDEIGLDSLVNLRPNWTGWFVVRSSLILNQVENKRTDHRDTKQSLIQFKKFRFSSK